MLLQAVLPPEVAMHKIDARTVYAEPIPDNFGYSGLLAFFSRQGEVLSINKRRHIGTRYFNGSIFVEFASEEIARAVRSTKQTPYELYRPKMSSRPIPASCT